MEPVAGFILVVTLFVSAIVIVLITKTRYNMKGYILFEKGCYLCGDRKGDLKTIRGYGIYGEDGKCYWYHERCLLEICCNPTQYTNLKVDRSIQIADLKEERRKERKKIEERYQKSLDRCKGYVQNMEFMK